MVSVDVVTVMIAVVSSMLALCASAWERWGQRTKLKNEEREIIGGLKFHGLYVLVRGFTSNWMEFYG